jgi:hypothetical protein
VLPLRRIIDDFDILRHGFADDSQLYRYFTLSDLGSLAASLTQLEKCTSAVRTWMIANKLKINDAKSELMIIAPKSHLPRIALTNPSITIGSKRITPVHKVRNLGGTFESTMSMDAHTGMVVRNTFYQIRRLEKIRGHLDKESAKKLCTL